METFEDRLKKFGKHLGSASKLAEELDMTAPSLQSYTNGRSKPGYQIISKLHNLGCNINWLLSGKGEMLLSDKSETILSEAGYCELANTKEVHNFLTTLDISKLNSVYWAPTGEGEEVPIHPLRLDFNKPYLITAKVQGNTMESYGINNNDLLLFDHAEKIEELENSVVIIHEGCNDENRWTYIGVKFTLRYYDKKTNQLLSGSNSLLPIPYNPELIVPARISSVIRSLE